MKPFHISFKCDRPSSESTAFAVSQSKTKAIGIISLESFTLTNSEFSLIPRCLSAFIEIKLWHDAKPSSTYHPVFTGLSDDTYVVRSKLEERSPILRIDDFNGPRISRPSNQLWSDILWAFGYFWRAFWNDGVLFFAGRMTSFALSALSS